MLALTSAYASMNLHDSEYSTRFRSGRNPYDVAQGTTSVSDTKRGGRHATSVGISASVWFGETDDSGGEVLSDWYFEFESPDGAVLDYLDLGTEAAATMTPVSQAPPEETIRPGSRLEVREGARTVAHGTVTDLSRHADESTAAASTMICVHNWCGTRV